jgi:glycine/D-amino acid oxidase-like deaminating enzyme
VRTGVAIIGGGLVGAATAHYLTRSGCDVALIDKGELNRGASGQNAGSLHFQLEHRLVEHGDALAELAAAIIPLSLDAIGRWTGIEADLGQGDLDIVMHGGLMVAEGAEQVARLERKARLEEKWRLPTQLIGSDEIRRLAPYLSRSIAGAALCRAEGHGNPRLITAALVRSASASRRLVLRTGVAVSRCARSAAGWRLELKTPEGSRETLEADAVVNAAGAWSADVAALAGLHLPVFPVALTMNATEAAPPFLGHMIQHIGRRLSMKQLREGNLLIGGGWSARLLRRGTRFQCDRRPDFRLDSITGNLAVAVDVVPRLRALHLLRSWTGIVGVTSDSLPILGEVPQAPGYFVATGGSGFTLGLTYGAVIAELITTRRTSLDITLFSPARFSPLNMFMGR